LLVGNPSINLNLNGNARGTEEAQTSTAGCILPGKCHGHFDFQTGF